MGSLSKQKGASFERFICVALSKWVSAGERDDLFWRSSMSGGRATIGKKAEKSRAQQAGDISAIDPAGHVLTDRFFIECKHVKDLHLTGFLLSGAGDLARYWKVARREAKAHGKEPMLIAKQNMYPVIMIVRAPEFLTYNKLGGAQVAHNLISRVPDQRADLLYFDLMMKTSFADLSEEWVEKQRKRLRFR